MSAFERRVRMRKSSAGFDSDTQFEALAQGVAMSNSDDELIERAAIAMRAYEIRQQKAQREHVEETGRRRAVVYDYAEKVGAKSRSEVKRALKADAERLRDVSVPAREAPSEPRSPSPLVVPTPEELRGAQGAYEFEQRRVRSDG